MPLADFQKENVRTLWEFHACNLSAQHYYISIPSSSSIERKKFGVNNVQYLLVLNPFAKSKTSAILRINKKKSRLTSVFPFQAHYFFSIIFLASKGILLMWPDFLSEKESICSFVSFLSFYIHA